MPQTGGLPETERPEDAEPDCRARWLRDRAAFEASLGMCGRIRAGGALPSRGGGRTLHKRYVSLKRLEKCRQGPGLCHGHGAPQIDPQISST
ncbi:hypothetical protein NDU88_000467 [Pleurodeles waltl]|uniref:Uncharacterized protein n=1 Tax=Pleurodeles waltl TaxID=8319 RepID=A0AAV7MKK7_PLEWA|nr:hypothetical protein NDU88_000467 [Pleurodeles waltl]